MVEERLGKMEDEREETRCSTEKQRNGKYKRKLQNTKERPIEKI